jgi:NAD(P)H dehydrogenase (quinone)
MAAMKASVILAHPYPLSFNHAIYETTCKTLGESKAVIYKHDLYAERFDPVLSSEELVKEESKDPLVNQYSKELIESDLLFFIHPNWWGQPPAILKGYIDRVIRPPLSYDFPLGDTGGGLPIGKLKGKTGVVFNTSNTDKDREERYFHDPLEFIWEKCIFGFCGIEKVYRKMFRIVSDSSDAERKAWLEEVKETVKRITGVIKKGRAE